MKDSRKGVKLPWSDTVDEEHLGDAYDFLVLHWLPAEAGRAVIALRDAEIVHFHPGDLIREAGLKPLPLDDTGVRREIVKALADGHFQLLLCIQLKKGIVLADGYHRASAAYALDPFHKVPLKLAPSPKDAFDA